MTATVPSQPTRPARWRRHRRKFHFGLPIGWAIASVALLLRDDEVLATTAAVITAACIVSAIREAQRARTGATP